LGENWRHSKVVGRHHVNWQEKGRENYDTQNKCMVSVF
jgi:hypothetical protein